VGCGGCYQARFQFVQAARSFDVRGAAQAVAKGVQINVDKMRARYGRQVIVKATPYRPPAKQPERNT